MESNTKAQSRKKAGSFIVDLRDANALALDFPLQGHTARNDPRLTHG
jgi:hypothetical protein